MKKYSKFSRLIAISIWVFFGLAAVLAKDGFAQTEEGWRLYTNKQYEKAIDEFQKAFKKTPKSPEVYTGIGWSNYQLKKYDEAEEAFKKAVMLDPGYASANEGLNAVQAVRYARFNTAWSLLYNGEAAKAIIEFKEVLKDKLFPPEERWRVHSGLGWSYYGLKKYSDAASEFKEVLKDQKDNSDAMKGLGFSYYYDGKYDNAIAEITRSLKILPNQMDAENVLAWSYLKKGDDNKAIDGFKKILNINPYLVDPHYGLAVAYYKKGEKSSAKEEFIKAVRLLPSYTKTDEFAKIVESEKWLDVLSEQGWSFYHFHQYQDSWDSFNKAISRGAKDANTLRGAGYAALKIGMYDDAVKYSNASLTKDPDLQPVIETVEIPGTGGFSTIQSNAQTTLGWGYYYKKDYKQAIKEFAKAIDKNPDWVDPLTGLGWSYYQEKRYDEAEEIFKKALKLDPSYSDALNGIAAARYVKYGDIQEGWKYYYAGDYQKSIQYLKKGLEALSNKLSSDEKVEVMRGIAWSHYWQKDYENAGKILSRLFPKKNRILMLYWVLGI